MIYEQVIVNSFLINRPRQVYMFQVKLPRETESIIGVETGLRWITGVPAAPPHEVLPWKLPMTILRNTYIGDLKLQSTERANIFFAKDIALYNNCGFGDFASQFFERTASNSLSNAEEEKVIVNGKATVIFGCYKDYLADLVSIPYQYKVSVYVWIRLKDNKTQQL